MHLGPRQHKMLMTRAWGEYDNDPSPTLRDPNGRVLDSLCRHGLASTEAENEVPDLTPAGRIVVDLLNGRSHLLKRWDDPEEVFQERLREHQSAQVIAAENHGENEKASKERFWAQETVATRAARRGEEIVESDAAKMTWADPHGWGSGAKSSLLQELALASGPLSVAQLMAQISERCGKRAVPLRTHQNAYKSMFILEEAGLVRRHKKSLDCRITRKGRTVAQAGLKKSTERDAQLSVARWWVRQRGEWKRA